MSRSLRLALALFVAILATACGWIEGSARGREVPALVSRDLGQAEPVPAPAAVIPQPALTPSSAPGLVDLDHDGEDDRLDQDADEPDHIGPDGHPRIGGDHPGEAAAFRKLSLQSENGEIAADGLMAAYRHVQEMKAEQPPPDLQNGAGITRGGWTWLGPGNIGGRVRAIAIHPTTPATMFAGGVDGGLWKTTNTGASWAPVDDFMANLAVSSIVFTPGSPNIMYAGTGEGFYNADGIRGAGVFKSTDGGTTWSQLASTTSAQWYYVNRLSISPDGTAILAATRTGIYRSVDGGATWNNYSTTEITDINFHPTDSSKAVASGYLGNAFYSTNGGVTWTAATGFGGGGRVEIAYAPSAPATVYASVELSGGSFYASTDGGATYTLRFNATPDYLGGQGWYGNALWVNPLDANFIVVGGVDLYKSTNGGTSWLKISNWAASPFSAHADHHMIVSPPGFNNSSNKTVFFGNDGGVYKAADISTVGGGGGADCISCTSGWTALNNNLGVTQFYGAGGHPGSGRIVGGTQDNGTLLYTPGGGPQGWTTTFGGDGGWSAYDPNNINNLYGEYVYLTLHRSIDGGATSDWINGLYWNGSSYICKPAPYKIGDASATPDGCSPTSYGIGANFISPFILDPNTSNRMLAGGLRLWRTDDAATPNTPTTGPSWLSIKPSTGFNISAIAVAKLNSDIIWVGHNNGDVYRTVEGTGGFPTWLQRDNTSPSLPNRMVTRITVDPTDVNIVYVAFGGYNSNNLYRTMDGGNTWTAIVGSGLTGLPAAPIRDLEINPSNSAWLYAATEVGLFTSQDAGATWMLPQDGPANVSVDELFFMGPDLVAVTHGRGIFKQTPVSATTPVAVTGRVTNAATSNGLVGVTALFYNNTGLLVSSAMTDGAGNYTTSLVPGTYYARTWNSQGFVNKIFNNIACTSSCEVMSGTPVVVTSGGLTGIDFALSAGGRIGGTITSTATGLPIAGVTVYVFGSGGEYLDSGFTDASGNYVNYGGLASGNYFVQTHATDAGPFVDEVYNNIACVNCDPTLGTAVSVTAGVTTGSISFSLASGGRVSGTVTNASTGAGIGNVSVYLFDGTGTFFAMFQTDASGNYATAGVPIGTYYAKTYAPPYVDKLWNNIVCIGCLPTIGAPINLSAGTTASGINFALTLGGTMTGTVTNQATGLPLANVDVQVFDLPGNFVTAARTDASGNYTTPGVPIGSYRAKTNNGLGFVDKIFNNLTCLGCSVTVGTPIAVVAGGTTGGVNFALSLGGQITGRVTSVATGTGVAGFVQIHSAGGTFLFTLPADGSGNYASAALPAGTYFVRTSNTLGYVDELYNNFTCVSYCDPTAGTPVTVTAGAPTTIDFALETGGRISGRVTNAAGGAGLSGVLVSVVSSTGSISSAVTDASGNYLTLGMTPGSYSAYTVNFVGFLDQSYPTPIVVTAGATANNIDFALVAGGRISGRVTNASTGAGLPFVSVQIYSSAGVQLMAPLTDASGNYTTPTGLMAGNYFAKTAASTTFINEVYDNISCVSCSATSGTPIAVTLGATTGNINFALDVGGRISGRVTNNATAANLAGVAIQVYTPSGAMVTASFSDASGNYTADGLAAGSYRVRTSGTAGYIDELYNDIVCAPNCDLAAGTPVPVTIGATTTGINFALTAGGRITGNVTNAANGQPLLGVSVYLYNASGYGQTISTNTSSSYISPGLPTGTYFLRTSNTLGFVDERYNNQVCLSGDVPCSATSGTGVPVTTGATTAGIDFALDAGGRITGHVTDAAASSALSAVAVDIYGNTGSLLTSVSSDVSGNYVTPALPGGAYFARTRNSLGFIDELYDNIVCAGCTVTGGTPITASPGALTTDVDFGLEPGGFITGTVTNAVNGTPLSGATVFVYNLSGSLVTSVSSNSSGSYVTATGLPTGTYFAKTGNSLGFINELYNNIACAVSSSCPVTGGAPIMVVTGATTIVNFALTPGGRFGGRVTNTATMIGVAGATVNVYSSAGALVTSANTDAAGYYTTPAGLPTGSYRAQTSNSLGLVNKAYNNVVCVGCPTTTGSVIGVTAGSTIAGVDFTLDPGGRISGTVTNASSSSGLANVTVRVYSNAGAQFTSAFTDASGNYTTSAALPTGSYYLRTDQSFGFINKLYNNIACAGCNVLSGTPVPVTAGSTTAGINFALQGGGGAIAGVVTNAADGAPLSGVSVSILTPASGLVTTVSTDASGNYQTATGLPAGLYYARTNNSLGFINEVYNDVTCLGCNVTAGAPIAVALGVVTNNIDFALAAGGRFSGTVTDSASGVPVPGVNLDIFGASGNLIASAASNASGSYLVPSGLPTGLYRAITANAGGQGYDDQAYQNISCLFSCTPVNGTPISVTAPGITTGIDFPLSRAELRILVSPSSGIGGSPAIVALTGALGGAMDWMALAPVGAPDTTYGSYVYVGAGVTTRTWAINLPATPGQYEVRLFANDGFSRLATSAPITVLPGLSINDVSLVEGNSGTTNFQFTVALSAPSSQVVTVQYATANGTATAGSDYTAVSGALTFNAGVVTQTITVPVSGDTAFEQAENFTVTLASPTNALLLDGQGVGTIQNDDLGPTLTINDVSVVEGDSGTANAVFTVSLAPTAPGTVTVDYAAANGTATSGSDYTTTTGTLTFLAGETTHTIAVPVQGDMVLESNETFFVNLANASVNAQTGDAQGVGTIINDEGPRLAVSASSVAGGASVTATLTNGLGGATDWLTLARVGALDTSYVTYVYVGDGVTTRTWTVPMPGVPGAYEFRLFANNTFTRLATSPAVNVLPGAAILDVSLNEGNSGTTNFQFTVALSAASAQTVTVPFSTADATATAASDYTTTSGTLTFNPGVLTQTITVPASGDTTFEPDETFQVNLGSPTNALILDGQGIGTIRNDDLGPTLTIDDVSVVEGDSGTVNAVFTVALNPTAAGTVTVNYATANGTATSGTDYTTTTGTLTFLAGVATQTITVPVQGDTVLESNETFFVNLTVASVNSVIGDAQGVGTIINDEGPRLAVSASSAAAGALVTATLTNGLGGAMDWITLARVGTPDMSYLAYVYVGAGLTTRTWSIAMPAVPGAYEFRLFQNDTFTRLATSPAVNVLPGIAIQDTSLNEGNSGTTNFQFTVALSGPSAQTVTVPFSTTDGTATAPGDYTTTSGTVTFSPGVLTQIITVPVNGDTTFEPSETFEVNLGVPVNALLQDGQGIGTIRNDDLGPTLTINDMSVAEGDSGTVDAIFTVTLNPTAAGTVTVNYATANGTATAGSDFTTTTGTLTFLAGEPTKTITVPVLGDMAGEPNETFVVNLTGASINAAIGDAQGVGTITNDDGPRITASASSVAPGAPVTFTLLNGPGGATDWMALAPVGAPNTSYGPYVYVGAGVSTRTWTVNLPLMPLGAYEARLFENNSFTRLATSPAVNVVPALAINDVSLNEGNSGTTNFLFTVTLSGASAQTITVPFSTADVTATAPGDYASTIGTLTFSPGVLTQTITVPVVGDTTFEPNETFQVNLGSPTNAMLLDGQGLGTIRNDDLGPTLTIDDVSLVEGDSGTVNAVFTVTLNPTAAGTVTVDYATTNGTATAGSDYTTTTGTLAFLPSETTKTISVPVIGDTAGEPNETFVVNLASASVNAAIGDAQGVGTITNDDGPRLTVPVSTVAPGTAVTFTLLNAPGGPADWMALAPVGAPNTTYLTYVYVGTGVTTRTWTVNLPFVPLGAYEVRLFENNTFNRLATSPAVTSVPGVVITDVSLNEGNSGTTNFQFTVTLSGPSAQTITVPYTTTDGTATAGSDYTSTTGTLTFNAGVTSQMITVAVSGDTTFEPNEIFTVDLGTPANSLIQDGQGLGTIRNDDAGPTLTIDDVSVAEGDSGTTNAVFTVTLNPTAAGTVTVNYATANGTATAGTDYTTTTGTLTFLAGETTKTIPVPVIGDTTGEPNETFVVNLAGASINAAIGDAQGAGTIANDDGARFTVPVSTVSAGSSVTFTLLNGPGGPADWMALAPVGAPNTTYLTYVYVGVGVTTRTWTVTLPSAPLGAFEVRLFENNTFNRLATSPAVTSVPGIVIGDVALNEGNSGATNFQFAVTLSAPSTQTITVQYATADATANAGSDYTAASGTLTFVPGSVSQTVSVPVNGDTTFEPNETFVVNLASPANGLLVDDQGLGTIRNDDAGPTLTIDDVSIVEGDSGTVNAVFTVTLAPTAGAPVTVDYATANGTATAGSDYTATGGTLTFAAGVSTQTITVPVIGDTGLEANETFFVNLSNLTGLAAIGDTQGAGAITNDDGPRVTVPVFTVSAGAAVTFTLLNGHGGATDWMALAPVGSPNTTYVAYTYVGASVTTRTWTVNLPLVPLGAYEVRLFENNTFNRLATSPPVTSVPGIVINDVSVNEGNSGTTNFQFAVTLSAPSTQTVTVQYATADTTATAGSDYTAASGTLTFAPGVTSQPITVAVGGDTTFEPNETFVVNLTSPANAVLVDNQGVGTIRNDDAGPTLTIDDVSVVEGDSGTVNAVFTVTLAPTAGAPVTVDYATANGTATAGSDYTATGGTLTFAAGASTQTITVPVIGDTGLEANETFFVNLSNLTGLAAIGDTQGAGTITNDDGPRVTVPVSTVSAGAAVTFTLLNGLGGATDWMALAPVGAANTTYVAYTYVGAGVTTRTWTVNLPSAPLGAYEVRLFANDSFTRLATSPPVTSVPGIVINDVSVNEGNSGTTNFQFAVTLSAPSTQTITVQYATADAPATAASDYTAASGTLTFAPGVTSQPITVAVGGDTTFEPNETFVVNLSSPANAVLVDNQGVGTIRNDDAGPTLTIDDVSLAEGSIGITNAVFTVTLNPTAAGTVTVDYVTANGTATAGSDYTATSGTLTFAAGASTQTITVPVIGDTAVEANETFLVNLTNLTGLAAVGDAQGAGTIVNDDGPALAVSTASVPAGGLVTTTLTNGLGGATDWIALALSSAPNTSVVTYVYVGAGVATRIWTIAMPSVAGQYEFRLFANDGYTRLATSPSVTVTPPVSCTDSDADRLCDSFETNTSVFVSATNTGTNPALADTDGDGIRDGDEVLGTLSGVNLPAMGTSPLKKNILLEYDWVADNSEPGSCTTHTHQPTPAMMSRVSAAFAGSPVTNPDGTTGVTVIQDYGQGGLFTGGTVLAHAANLVGGVNGADFNGVKAGNFAANRAGIFHYVLMAHWFTDSLGSSGQAELPGNDMTVTLGCYSSTTNVANTIMHELGHNLNLRHGGNENCNWKPNYNSVMNYRFQFFGADTSCDAIGDYGESNVLDYSRGVRVSLNENNLNENAGTCGGTAIDWNFSGTLTSGVVHDLNRTSDFPNASTPVDNSACSATLQTLTDYNDWASLSYVGIGDSDGQTLFGMFLKWFQEMPVDTAEIPQIVPVAIRRQ